MEDYLTLIEKKYKAVSRLPEKFMSFTVPVRKRAIAELKLQDGDSVIDVGCGTGASFQFLEEVIGVSGRIVGVEPSISMIEVARSRIKGERWENIEVLQSTIEDADISGQFDGALLFAMHDVFNSTYGLSKIHSLLKPGARIVCAGPMKLKKGFLKIVNPLLDKLFMRMAISQENKDEPWREAAKVFTTDEIIFLNHGILFIFIGHK